MRVPGTALESVPIDTPAGVDYCTVAQTLWPGLDRRRLRRTGCDPNRIARLVSRRTAVQPENIVAMLAAAGAPDGDTRFG